MNVETRTSKRGHEYKIYRGTKQAVSVFQGDGTNRAGTGPGMVHVRWPWPSSDQQRRAFKTMDEAVAFAKEIAGGGAWDVGKSIVTKAREVYPLLDTDDK